MNPYYYWFFTIYHIYAKFNGRDFPFFASGMFSVLCYLLILDITHPLTLIITQKKPEDIFFIFLFIIFILLFIINDFLFLYKKRHEELYKEVYLKNRKRGKDAIFIIFSISILGALFFYTAMYDQFKSVFIR